MVDPFQDALQDELAKKPMVVLPRVRALIFALFAFVRGTEVRCPEGMYINGDCASTGQCEPCAACPVGKALSAKQQRFEARGAPTRSVADRVRASLANGPPQGAASVMRAKAVLCARVRPAPAKAGPVRSMPSREVVYRRRRNVHRLPWRSLLSVQTLRPGWN